MVASARREFLEEAGLSVEKIELRGTFIRVLDVGFINEMYVFVASGFNGQQKDVTDEGTIDEFLTHPDVVDHIPYYLCQVIEGKDFYCGMVTCYTVQIKSAPPVEHFCICRPIMVQRKGRLQNFGKA